MSHPRIPITIITGFAGSGKTTLILNLLPQLRASNPSYTLALIKNEIGDVNVDSALASAAELTATQELLGDCICCVNVGQIGDALSHLASTSHPDRIIIETSGSAEPLKLVLEINRLAKETGRYELDGIVSVIDAENWGGYANTSYTAKLQAKQTDLIVINKWEGLGEREFDVFLDRLGDLDVETPQVKSQKGVMPVEVLFGLDGKMARGWAERVHDHGEGHDHAHHTSEIECLSITLSAPSPNASTSASIDLPALSKLLSSAPKDEVYRIKALVYSTQVPPTNFSDTPPAPGTRNRYILNWSFGRWTWSLSSAENDSVAAPALRMSIFTAPYESTKWKKRVEEGGYVKLEGEGEGKLEVKRVQ